MDQPPAPQAPPPTPPPVDGQAHRRARLLKIAQDALSLVDFAAANARKLDDGVRNQIVATNDAIERGVATVADEQALLKAYEAVSVALAPVTAETLVASGTRLPSIDAWRSWATLKEALKHVTFGRFVDAFVFLLVLALTCVSLSYFSMGSTGLARYHELGVLGQKAQEEEQAKTNAVGARDADLMALKSASTATPAQLRAADEAYLAAKQALATAEKNSKMVQSERQVIPDRLWRWAHRACEPDAWVLFSLTLCTSTNKELSRPVATPVGVQGPTPVDLEQIEAARTVASRMSEIYLPLLLGWLGAHAYLLRKMTREIAEGTFAKSSALRHIIRLGLGALAGFASTWLLTPQMVGGDQLKSLPVWALAFIAGYGIELVFAFMDRIIAAFTKQ